MNKNARVFVAGHRGLVGSAIVRRLAIEGCAPARRAHPRGAFLDLGPSGGGHRRPSLPSRSLPTSVLAGGPRRRHTLRNDTYRGEFIRDNLLIEANVIDAAYRNGVEKLPHASAVVHLILKHAPQPMKEEHLSHGALEPTNPALRDQPKIAASR